MCKSKKHTSYQFGRNPRFESSLRLLLKTIEQIRAVSKLQNYRNTIGCFEYFHAVYDVRLWRECVRELKRDEREKLT